MVEIIDRKLMRHAKQLGRKRRVIFHDCEALEIHACDLMWSGGTRYHYTLMHANGFEQCIEGLGLATSPFDNEGKLSADFAIPTGCVVVKRGTFCGKTATVSVYGRKSDALELQTVVG